jgi:hypothetical protein
LLDGDELADVAAAFGVDETQVRRDHLVSHILNALATLDVPVTFFGGTALARTHLSDPDNGARLSEDIDLYSPERRTVARSLDDQLPRLLRREFPGLSWDPPLSLVRSVVAGQVLSRDGMRVRVQLLDSRGDHHDLGRWPTETRPIDLRYRDLPASVDLAVPTLTAFAAMKTIAWLDRHTARDLYDLAGLAGLGALTAEVTALIRRMVGWSPAPQMFGSMPALDWTTQLAHQTRSALTAEECLTRVRKAYSCH